MYDISKLIGIEKKIILASKSPRRKLLLSQLGFNFEIDPADIDESLIHNGTPEEYVMHLAESKASFIAQKYDENFIILGADTIVVLDDFIINKPENEKDAENILLMLSDNTHYVYTGIAFSTKINSEFITKSYVEATKVTFRALELNEIRAYIASGSPMDKAGAYGIQDDFGAVFVSRIEGCYYNIVGLPLQLLYVKLKEFIQFSKSNS